MWFSCYVWFPEVCSRDKFVQNFLAFISFYVEARSNRTPLWKFARGRVLKSLLQMSLLFVFMNFRSKSSGGFMSLKETPCGVQL